MTNPALCHIALSRLKIGKMLFYDPIAKPGFAIGNLVQRGMGFMASRSKKALVHKEKSIDSEFSKKMKTNPLIFGGTIFVLVIVIVAFVFVPAMGHGAGKAPDLTLGITIKHQFLMCQEIILPVIMKCLRNITKIWAIFTIICFTHKVFGARLTRLLCFALQFYRK